MSEVAAKASYPMQQSALQHHDSDGAQTDISVTYQKTDTMRSNGETPVDPHTAKPWTPVIPNGINTEGGSSSEDGNEHEHAEDSHTYTHTHTRHSHSQSASLPLSEVSDT